MPTIDLMKRPVARPTAVAAGTVILLFGMVWILSAWDLSFVGSFLAAAAVAAAVAAGIHLFKSSTELGERGSRLAELMQRSPLSRRSIRDESTGLLNRWYLEQRLNEEAARCLRYGYSMAVVVLKARSVDLSRFSLDGWQEEQTMAARRCAQVIRNVDLSAALAPFEFALCLVHCDRNGAEAAVARIAQEFWEYDCWVGISLYPLDECEPGALIELAKGRSMPVTLRPSRMEEPGAA
jgi:GGDEF domain-containing protein